MAQDFFRTIKAFKAGKVKLDELRPGLRPRVQRLAKELTHAQLDAYLKERPAATKSPSAHLPPARTFRVRST